jgi:DNA-directed RNA polymerase subunit RPC12/RpoP
MNKFLWVLTVLGCVIGGLIGVGGVVLANGAPQEAAAAAIAVACAVIPYCLARAADELGKNNRQCPYCAGSIKKESEICKFCKNELPYEEDLLPATVECPACKRELGLCAKERIERKYECSSCGKHINMTDSEMRS